MKDRLVTADGATVFNMPSNGSQPYVPQKRFRALRLFWCNHFHNDLSWPSHGKYACRRCGIVFTVPWRQGDNVAEPSPAPRRLVEVSRRTMAAALLLLSTKAAGQDAPRRQRVEGTVTNEAGQPIQGAAVKIKNLQNLVIRSAVSRSDGRFFFNNLSTDADYEVWAQHEQRLSNKRTLDRFETDAVLQVRLTIPDR